MNYLTHSDKCFLQQLNLANKKQAAMVLDEMFGTQFSATVGVRAIIYGSESCDMHDHAPGFAYFTRDAERLVVFLKYIEMPELREIAMAEFHGYREKCPSDGQYDGMFFPHGIRILNAHNEVVDLYKNGRWAVDGDDLIPHSKWDIVESEIKRLRSEASVEAGWDNFETARGMRQHARRLEERLSLSRFRASSKAQQCKSNS